MSKWYEVELSAHKVMMVEMPDDASEDEAYEFASNESGFSAFIMEGKTTLIEGAEKIETCIRHADEVERL